MTEPVGTYTRQDEAIDLRALCVSLWNGRRLLLLVTLLITACAILYAVLATPYYEVRSLLRPAAIKDLDELNGTDVYELSPEDALKRVGAALASYENRYEFVRSSEALSNALAKPGRTFAQAFEYFNDRAFTMLQPDPKKQDALTSFVGLSLTYPRGVDGVALVNGLVEFAIARERARIEEDFRTVVNNRLSVLDRRIQAARAAYDAVKEAEIARLLEGDTIKRALLKDELEALRQMLRTRRDDRLAELEEAIAIARALGIHKPTNPTSLGETPRTVQGSVIRTEVNNQDIPLHFMGTEALSAERNALRKRTSDDFTEPRIAEIHKELRLLEQNRTVQAFQARENDDLFLKELGELREEAGRLRALKVDFTRLNLVRIDQLASEPLQPIKPRRALIVAVGIVLGLLLGALVVLLRDLLRGRLQPR
ncbi:Wzz/FepE/Etk N-terminal domain-containing protein [Pseudomonas sp. NW5]|uniref:Wzz/FepE/Etk N-terminal domain-containing protein n=1 Tax=Pseudomonas sp. NW5 TaxID=2934934 RepID=UPI00201FE058|nr:Wzz/FepE/Etk N-terminal domain-containing protein [Pseudomonas sp. NW5]